MMTASETPPRKMNRRWVLALIVGAVVVAGIAVALVDVAPKRALTDGNMMKLRDEIAAYAVKNNRLPENLRQLPAVQAGRVESDDRWGFPIRYSVREGRIVLLTSIGPDGLEGGTAHGEDLVGVFDVRGRDGKWNAHPEWLHDPGQRGPVTWDAPASPAAAAPFSLPATAP